MALNKLQINIPRLQQFYQYTPMQAIEARNKRIRAISAGQSRPFSSSSRQAHKTELIENVYNGSGIHSKKGEVIALLAGSDEHFKFRKLMPTRQSKEYEQYFEEIMHLKATINKLNDQLTTQKTKIQMLERRNNKYDKQMKMQFQKQLYWTGTNTHMITGIKSSYDALKAKYEEKCKSYEKMSKDVKYTEMNEYKVYLENLEQQNSRLVEKIQILAQSAENKGINHKNKEVSEYFLRELENKNRKLEIQLRENEALLKTANEELKDRDKKIMFLEKLIIEKDNTQYHSHRKAKKFEKEKQDLVQELASIKNQLTSDRETFENRMDEMKNMYELKLAKEKEEFLGALDQKEAKIQKYDKEVTYLSTLLTYRKPLEDSKDLSKKFATEEKSMKEDNPSPPNNLKESLIKERKSSIRKDSSEEEILAINMVMNKTGSQEIDLRPKQPIVIARVQQNADKRHSQGAEKKRKVTYEEVKEIGQLLKYKFIAKNLSIEDAKKGFDYVRNQSVKETDGEKQSGEADKQEEEKWKQKYITMEELIVVLKAEPFSLNEESAYQLSRYMIENSLQQYVYCDLMNEQLRSIIKSILKAVVGQYQPLSAQELDAVNQECDNLVKLYEGNLLAALKTVASSGYASSRKFVELLSSLGIEASDNGKQMLVGRLALKSESLSKLNYKTLWDSQ